MRPLETAEYVHGATGFEGYDLPEPTTPAAAGFAPDRIVELVMSRPEKTVTLACLAPLTNIALAMVQEPRLAGRLAEATQHSSHGFWPDDVSLLTPGVIDWHRVLGHRQVTDDYLLALAVRHGGRFVTFDARVQLAAVAGAKPADLVVLTG